MKAKPAELILSLAVSSLGIATAIGTAQLPSAGGYARIGPNIAPAVIAGGLILLGLWLLYETLTGGWRNATADNPSARGEHDQRAGGIEFYRKRHQHGDRKGRTNTGQDADEGAQYGADETPKQIQWRQGNAEAV